MLAKKDDDKMNWNRASEIVVRCTTPIMTINGQVIGTGFFYRFKENSEGFTPVIVTNRHVLKDLAQFKINVHFSNNNQEKYHKNLIFTEKHVIFHPNEKIDLAIVCNLGISSSMSDNESLNNYYIGKDFLLNQEELRNVGTIEDILVIGYPNGIYDSQNNLPIVRHGITATDIRRNYMGESVFLIDSEIVKGSSGSPVFLFNRLGYYKNEEYILSWRIKLIGINSSVYTQDWDTILFNQFNSVETNILTKIPIGLGVILKAHLINDFEDLI